MSKLLIDEPPLQVLPSLALAIGLNEAIVLQQIHYLLRNPKFGRVVADQRWIFNTIQEWIVDYFPFWSERTLKTVFSNLKTMGLIITCQPEGRASRRQYYRIDEEVMEQISDGARIARSMGQPLPDGKGQNSSLPYTKTTAETSSKSLYKESASHSEEKTEEQRPSKPILRDIVLYANQIGLGHGDAEAFFDHYEAQGWKIGVTPIVDWRAKLRSWKRNLKKRRAPQPPQRTEPAGVNL